MSSSTGAAVDQGGGTQTICRRSLAGTYYEFEWNHKFKTKPKSNEHGTSGWATVLHSSNPKYLPGMICRFHLCKHNPCKADYAVSKYGQVGPPIHLQEEQKESELSAVAAASGSQLPLPAAVSAAVTGPSSEAPPPAAVSTAVTAPAGSQLPLPAAVSTAVAGPSSEASPPAAGLAPVGPAPVVEPAPVEEPATTLKQAAVSEPAVEAAMPDAPACPREAALKNMKPPAPASPIHVDSQAVANSTAQAVTAVAPPAVAAQHKIHSTLSALAREIRRPRAYVGYSAFILMGLLKQCRPCAWEGSTFIDLLQVFAPWAKERCTQALDITAVPCTLVAEAGGSVVLVPICAEHPLSKTIHFVAGIQIPESPVKGSACGFETLYASLGVAVLRTVLNGDCALDVMTMMLGIPSTPSTRAELRIDISDYLIDRIREPWLHDIMVACQELHKDDVTLHRSSDGTLLASPTAPAPAVADPAVAAVEEKDVVTPNEEIFAAMRGVSKLSDDSCVLGLIRSLPMAVVEEQVSL